jgi:signal transduction histidine kinase
VVRTATGSHRLSIGARWVLAYTAATSLLLLLLSLLVYNRIETLIFDGLEQDLRLFAHSISETIARDPDDLRAVAVLIEATIASSAPELELAIELYDEQLQLVLQRDIMAPFPKPLQREDLDGSSDVFSHLELREAPHPYLVHVEANGQGFTRASIYAGSSVRELSEIRDVFGAGLVIGVALTGIVGWLLARQALRPISEITKTARRFSALGNEGWIPTRGTGDELDELAETLNRMLERIRHATDGMKRFAAQAAHELLTPLGVSRTRIEVTLLGAESKQAYREALGAVLAEVEELGRTVNGILDLARSGAGLDPARVETIVLSEMLADIAEFYRVVAADRGIELHPPPSVQLTVCGDPIWLNRLFSNLVDNAIKHSTSGGSIDFALAEENDWVCVSIQDTGIGIAVEDRHGIFDHFYRIDRERTSGHGLGLALAMEIARAHDGTIEYEGPETGGSVFHVRLPVSETSAAEAVAT